MSRERSIGTAVRDPAVLGATLGWSVTGVTLFQYAPELALATLLIGLPAWILDRNAVAYAVTQVGIATATPEAAIATVALLEAGPTLLLISVMSKSGGYIQTVVPAVGIATLLGGVTIAGFIYGGSIFVAVGVVLAMGIVCGYAIHRYELVSLGLVRGENA